MSRNEEESKMNLENLVFIVDHEGGKSYSICLNIESDYLMNIGEKMEAIHDEAYMNGYNWQELFIAYLKKYNPELSDIILHDAEAGSYIGICNTEDAKEIIEKYENIIKNLIKDEKHLMNIFNELKDNVDWD